MKAWLNLQANKWLYCWFKKANFSGATSLSELKFVDITDNKHAWVSDVVLVSLSSELLFCHPLSDRFIVPVVVVMWLDIVSLPELLLLLHV